jgi:hypothetical protein
MTISHGIHYNMYTVPIWQKKIDLDRKNNFKYLFQN